MSREPLDPLTVKIGVLALVGSLLSVTGVTAASEMVTVEIGDNLANILLLSFNFAQFVLIVLFGDRARKAHKEARKAATITEEVLAHDRKVSGEDY